MTKFIFPFLISMLVGMGIGGVSASFFEGCYDTRKLVFVSGMYASVVKQVAGGPQHTSVIKINTKSAVEGAFFYD